jgi:hypothetical protein
MTPKLRLGLIVGAIVALGAAGIAGWVRELATASASFATNPEPVAAPVAVSNPTTGTPSRSGYDEYGQPRNNPEAYNAQPPQAYTPPPDTPSANYYTASAASSNGCQYPTVLPAYASPHYVRTIHARVEAPGFYAEGYGSAPAPARVYREEYRVHGRHHRRSVGKSVAIVAGSAGVGAAIGGIAGGGKGAGIGALAGGAGGFIYDRLTRH